MRRGASHHLKCLERCCGILVIGGDNNFHGSRLNVATNNYTDLRFRGCDLAFGVNFRSAGAMGWMSLSHGDVYFWKLGGPCGGWVAGIGWGSFQKASRSDG